MKSKLYLAPALICVMLFASACPEWQNGPEITEPGEVYDTCFVPKGHGSDVAIGYSMAGKGGVTVTPVDIDIPARYAIVFKCQHGKFVIDGERGERLYKKLSKGDHVTIRYCECFEVDGGKTNAADLHFIDADVVKQ